MRIVNPSAFSTLITVVIVGFPPGANALYRFSLVTLALRATLLIPSALATSPRAIDINSGSLASIAASMYAARSSGVFSESSMFHLYSFVFMSTSSNCCSKFPCSFYVRLLCRFISTGQQYYNFVVSFRVIYPISRTKVESQFKYSVTHRLHVPNVAVLHSSYAHSYPHSCHTVFKPRIPFHIQLGLAYRFHATNCSIYITSLSTRQAFTFNPNRHVATPSCPTIRTFPATPRPAPSKNRQMFNS